MLAESWKIAPDASYVDFMLRKGIKFHDGEDFNAQAVKVNIDIQITSPIWTNLWPLKSCEVIDDYTVRMYFDETFDWGAITSLATFFSCRMFSPKFLTENTDEYKRSHVIGTGPFILSDYKRGQYIKYVRNDNYWRGKPYLDGIEYRIIPQPETQLLAFKAGEVHFVALQAKDADATIAEGYTVDTTYAFVFNGGLMGSAANADSPWADIRVRRAAAHAIDQDLLVSSLYYGYGRTSNQVFIEGTAWFNPDTVGYNYDPEKSKALLAEAGYPNGFETTWYLIDYMSLDVPTAVQDMLRQVGIEAKFELVSMPIYNSQVAAGWEGIVWGGVFAGTAFEPSSCLVNGVLNGKTTWVSCIQPDEQYEKGVLAGRELDPVKRAKMYQEISKTLTDDYCQIAWLPYAAGIVAYSPKLKNYEIGYSSFQYTFAWLE
jgi:peptide/nickel transport system substrate-binding protein